jgi:hypothetical protein
VYTIYTQEKDTTINFLDLLIYRTNVGIEIEIYRKPTTTETVIHFTSNHPYEHKIAAFRFQLTRMQRLQLNLQNKQKEWMNILHIARTNGNPLSLIVKLNTQIQQKLSKPNMTSDHPNNPKIWTTFTFHNPIFQK